MPDRAHAAALAGLLLAAACGPVGCGSGGCAVEIGGERSC